jgi:predicted restriction endonuclease
MELENDIETIYFDMITANYSINEIILYFFIQYNIDITDKKYNLKLNRCEQKEFRQKLLHLFNNKCIISGSSFGLEACHIIPFAESNNMSLDNGLILSSSYHKMFDEYLWSINPKTLQVEVCNELMENKNDPIVEKLIDKKIEFNFSTHTLKYLAKHYDTFLCKC